MKLKICGHWSTVFGCWKNKLNGEGVKEENQDDITEDELAEETLEPRKKDPKKPTESIEEQVSDQGKYALSRAKLDYKYHSHYGSDRILFQDSIIESLLGDLSVRDTTPAAPWLIYMMGPLFSGKNFALKTFEEQATMPLLSYILIDVDEVRHLLPEFKNYNSSGKDHREAGLIGEIAQAEALSAGKNVIVNCNPVKSEWYKRRISYIRDQYPRYRIAIIHVTAPTETIVQNTLEHERLCSLTVPPDMIEQMIDEIPSIFEELKPKVNYTCEIFVQENQVNLLSDTDWDEFQSTWMQSPKHNKSHLTRELQRKAYMLAFNAAPPKPIRHRRVFSAMSSTEDNYQTSSMEFYGEYHHIRSQLDYTYHKNYTKQRQLLQDRIISLFIAQIIIEDRNGLLCTTPSEPFVVFTAGAMGAGKGHTIKKLVEWYYFPLMAFVIVDPDEIRRHFPEYNMYLQECPEHAGTLTRKEAGFVAEILTAVALEQQKNVLVDGSLRDSEWYKIYFQHLRDSYPLNKLAIIHVTAPRDTIFQRAEERGKLTGRIVPRETLIEAMEQVPHSVNILKDLVNVYVEINNPSDADIHISNDENMSWESFRSIWKQTCAFDPIPRRSLGKHKTRSSYI